MQHGTQYAKAVHCAKDLGCLRTHERSTGISKAVLTAHPCASQPPPHPHPPHPRTRLMTLQAAAVLHKCQTLMCAGAELTFHAHAVHPPAPARFAAHPECPSSQSCPQSSTRDQPHEARLMLRSTRAGYMHPCFDKYRHLERGRSCDPCFISNMSGSQAGHRTVQRGLRVSIDERGRIAGAPQQAPHSLQPHRRSCLQLQPHLPQARRASCQRHGAPSAATSSAAAC